MIHGQCTNYPRLPAARQPDRELLDVLLVNGANQTAADAVAVLGTVALGGEIDFENEG